MDSVVIATPPTGSEAPVTPPPAVERPAWLPEKFKSPEDLAKAYGELEKKQGSGVKPAVEPVAQQQQQQQDVSQTDFSNYTKELSEKGNLSDESYKALEAKGYPKAIVDDYIAGQQARQAATESKILESIGGREQFDKLAEWAGSNLNDGEKAAYEKAIDSGDPATIQLAVQGLHAKFLDANGRPPKLIGGGSASTSDVYENWNQVTAAMNDPRYRTDAAYRGKVEQKIGRSNL
jgi:hypothetical protein